jgi:hypothetical protein
VGVVIVQGGAHEWKSEWGVSEGGRRKGRAQTGGQVFKRARVLRVTVYLTAVLAVGAVQSDANQKVFLAEDGLANEPGVWAVRA